MRTEHCTISEGLVMQLFHDIQGCSINTTSHGEGWQGTLKVYHDWNMIDIQ